MKEENDMNERTKPKGIGIAATVLIAALLTGVVVVASQWRRSAGYVPQIQRD